MGVTTAVPHDVLVAGAEWWGARFGDVDRVGFSAPFLPALLKSCRLEPTPGEPTLSLDELRVVAKYCVADAAWQHDAVTKSDFIHFLARFGPLEACAERLVESLTVRGELVTWFHGAITRAEAERLLLAPSTTPPLEDGAFLVRFSDSQPSRFCVSYLKVHATGPHIGRREVRNVLIENAGSAGFMLTDTRSKVYPSIRMFVQRTATRLKHGIASSLARRCNMELAAVRTHQDLASNSYTTFSTDSLEPSLTSSPPSPSFKPQPTLPSSLLFTKSPPAGVELLLKYGNNQAEHVHHEDEDENYSGFTKSSFLPRPLSIKSIGGLQTKKPVNGAATAPSNGYGSFSAAAVVSHERSPPSSPARTAARRQIPIITPPVGSDYGDFSVLTSAVTSFSRVIPPRPPLNGTANNNNDEYASFESIVTSGGASTVPPKPAPSAVSSQDTYGAFEPFEVMPRSTSSVAVSAAQPPPRSPLVESSDDYGSFASITFSSSDSDRSGLRAAVSTPQPAASSATEASDVYGTFSLSPNFQAQASTKTHSAASVPPPLALDEVPPSTVPVPSRPPASVPSNMYGSFDSLTLTEQSLAPSVPLVTPAPHSAPAAMTPLEAVEQDELESKVSALDELNAGMEFYKQKRLDDALLRFIGAREAAQRAQDQVVEARALGNLGTVYLDKQNPQQAVLCYQQCLEIVRAVQDTKRERLILNNLVLALMAAEDWTAAYDYCQIQLETTVSEVNRRKILTRMSELRERAARASRGARSSAGSVPLAAYTLAP